MFTFSAPIRLYHQICQSLRDTCTNRGRWQCPWLVLWSRDFVCDCLHSSRSSYSKIRENEVRLSERKERLQDKNYFKMAVSFRQRSITFLTFLLTCLALALLAGGLSTQYWVVAQAEIKNKTQASGFINFGLFEGTRRLNVGYGERRTPMDILDILYKDNSFMIKDLYITTLGCICASMLFGILSAIMAIVNTASTPSEKICQIPGKTSFFPF